VVYTYIIILYLQHYALYNINIVDIMLLRTYTYLQIIYVNPDPGGTLLQKYFNIRSCGDPALRCHILNNQQVTRTQHTRQKQRRRHRTAKQKHQNTHTHKTHTVSHTLNNERRRLSSCCQSRMPYFKIKHRAHAQHGGTYTHLSDLK